MHSWRRPSVSCFIFVESCLLDAWSWAWTHRCGKFETCFDDGCILLKPKLEEILELTNKVGAYGVNVAHSGTVVGILYDDHVDVDKLKDLFVKRGITKDYVKIHLVNTTRGGVKIY